MKLSLLTLTLFAPLAFGAQAAQRLTLERALEIAQTQNLDLIAAREGRAIAQAGIVTAQERPNPAFNFNVLRDTPHEGFWFSQPIELGAKRAHRIAVARAQRRVTGATIATLALKVRQAVREAYYNLALAQGTVLQLQQAEQLAERLVQIAQVRYQAGDAAELDVIQAKLGLAQATANLEVSEQQEKVALSQLNALLDEPATTEWRLTSQLKVIPSPAPLSQLVEKAYQASPAIRTLRRELDVARSQESLYKAQRVPNLDLEYGLDFNSPGQGGFRVGPRGQVTFDLPVFNRNQGPIAQSLADQVQLSDQIAAERRSIAGSVETNNLELASQLTKVNLYASQLVPASAHLEQMAEESYRAGKTDILAVLAAQQGEQNIAQQYLQSQYAAQSAFAALEAAVGAPLQ